MEKHPVFLAQVLMDRTVPLSNAPLADRGLLVGFYFRHLLFPVVIVLLASGWLLGMGGDQSIADGLYRIQGGHWALKRHVLTQQIIHDLGKQLSIVSAAIVAGLYAGSFLRPSLRTWRRPLLYLLLAIGLSTGQVSLIKSLTQMDCPWDLLRYGGNRPYVGLFETRPSGLGDAACFPAGHASAGYAWLALYFFALATRPAWRWRGLSIGLIAGAVFGAAQQLRGAHFLSHDLWTALICWTTALLLYRWLLAGRTGTTETRRESSAFPPPRSIASSPQRSAAAS